MEFAPELDRVEIIDFINAQGYVTYLVRQDRINDYLKSLLDLATLLTHNMIYQGARDEVIDDVVGLIREYIEDLHPHRQIRCTGRSGIAVQIVGTGV